MQYAKPRNDNGAMYQQAGGALGSIIGMAAAAPTGGMSIPVGAGLGSAIGGGLGGMMGGQDPQQAAMQTGGNSMDELLAEIARLRG
jgi:phage tail tape-measure protein